MSVWSEAKSVKFKTLGAGKAAYTLIEEWIRVVERIAQCVKGVVGGSYQEWDFARIQGVLSGYCLQ